MFVGQKMTKNPITVRPETPVTEAHATMLREKIHHLPVCDKHNKLAGIVTEKDLLYAMPSPASTLDVYEMRNLLEKIHVEKIMQKKVITVHADTPIEDAARIMADNNIGGLPVMEAEKLVGIITESDIFRLFIELFGTRRKGIRLTLTVPDVEGVLSQISSAVYNENGNIVSLGTFLGEDSTRLLMVMKVEGVEKDRLLAALSPHVAEITDVREA